MKKAQGNRRAPRSSSSKIFLFVGVTALVLQLLPDLETTDFEDAEASSVAFAVPQPQTLQRQSVDFAGPVSGDPQGQFQFQEPSLRGRTARPAAAAATATIGQKVINAMGAGAVASVIQAALSAVGEPIVNRVLVKRMKIMEALNDVTPSMMLDFFKTTLTTNFLKFPFFEAINAFCAALPINASIRGFVTGLVFTTATLPVTNYRYRKSMQLEVNWGNIYEAYFPTVIRDIVYGIVRNYSTFAVLAANPNWIATSPQVLFIVVILGCLGSAPFNEWRGYLLQSKGQELTFSEFFKPSNFVRSTSLGALKQGLALGVGYWCAPPATKFVHSLIAGFRG